MAGKTSEKGRKVASRIDSVEANRAGARRPFPRHSLQKALILVEAIGSQNAGRPMDRLLLADAIGRTPSSAEFRDLLSSSLKYGLTEGTEKAELIKPTPLGLQITRPQRAGEREEALRKAALIPDLFNKVYQHFEGNKLPQGTFFRNMLERTFGVPAEWTEELAALIEENAKRVGFLREISGAKYIRVADLSGGSEQAVDESPSDELSNDGSQDKEGALSEGATEPDPRLRVVPKAQLPAEAVPDKAKQIFVAHGKNREPLGQLKSVLDQFKIPYKVALDEPHAGRPISQKVASLMKDCSAAVFIFTKDEEFKDSAGDSVWRPSENAVYELGAAAVLYGTKIIIFKEEGIKFASDFQDLGYITFKPGEISARALDLLRELIALDFIRVQPV